MRDRLTLFRPLNSSETSQNSYGEDQVSAPAGEEFSEALFNEVLFGGPGSSGLVLVGTFPGQVECMAGAELERMQEKWAEAKYKITMRHQPGIEFTAKMYAIWLSRTADASLNRTLDILNINDPGNTLRPTITIVAKDFAG